MVNPEKLDMRKNRNQIIVLDDDLGQFSIPFKKLGFKVISLKTSTLFDEGSSGTSVKHDNFKELQNTLSGRIFLTKNPGKLEAQQLDLNFDIISITQNSNVKAICKIIKTELNTRNLIGDEPYWKLSISKDLTVKFKWISERVVKHDPGMPIQFVVDDYIPLKPNLKKAWEFVGRCPKTKKSNGIIVNEYNETIDLPYLNRSFSGRWGIKKFEEFMFMEFHLEPRSLKYILKNVSQTKARRVNAWLRKLSAQIAKNVEQIYKKNKGLLNEFYDYEFELKIDFFLKESHPLYHPESDNILFHYEDTLTFPSKISAMDDLLIAKLDYSDTNWLVDFKHCYLFYDLTDHKGLRIDDLDQVDFAWVDLMPTFQQKFIFSTKKLASSKRKKS